jgi:hypothetical protein
VVELPTMGDDYLHLSGDPHVLIRHDGYDRFATTYRFGAPQGEIDGREDEAWTHAAGIFLTFAGTDEDVEG